jgi:hypothetical protein
MTLDRVFNDKVQAQVMEGILKLAFDGPLAPWDVGRSAGLVVGQLPDEAQRHFLAGFTDGAQTAKAQMQSDQSAD